MAWPWTSIAAWCRGGGRHRRAPRRVRPGWSCDVDVDGSAYRVGILAIPADGPRPDTWGVVRAASGQVIWQDRVPGSADARLLLRLAGLTP